MRRRGPLVWVLLPLVLLHTVFYGLVLEICPSEGARIRIESHSDFESCEPGKHVFTDAHGASVRELDLSAMDEFPPIPGLAERPASPAVLAAMPGLPVPGPYREPILSVEPKASPPSLLLLPRLSSVVIRV